MNVIDKIKIYKLIDPLENSVKYIGWTHKPLEKRLQNHLSDARRGLKNHRCNWIRKLLLNGVYPIINIIEEVDYEERNRKEKYWISYYGRENLVNGTDGGEGVCGLLVSNDTRKKSSISHKNQNPWNKGILTDTSHLKDFQFKNGTIPKNKSIHLSAQTIDRISKSKSGKSIGKNSKTKNNCFGVTYNKAKNIWISQITFLQKAYYIGRYSQEEDAGIAYDICSLWLSNTIRNLNFPNKLEEYKFLLSSNKDFTLKELRSLIQKYLIKNGGLNYAN